MMLTGDLLRVSCRDKKIKPKFIDCDDPALLALAHHILSIFRNGTGLSKSKIEADAEEWLAPQRERKLADGLMKLAMDRAEFTSPEDEDYPAVRSRIFLRSAAMLRAGRLPADFNAVHDAVFRSLPDVSPSIRSEIFCDLPEFERLRSFKTTFDRELLERYNVSLVQTLLLFTDSMELLINAKTEAALLRRFFHYLKFFRLLFEAEFDSARQRVRLTIDGPASILEHSAKYGLQIASFFPAVCQLPEWSLSAGIAWRQSHYELKLNQDAGLVSHYANFNAYQPEEIKLFARSFRELESQWTIDELPGWISEGGQKLLFPDFTFSDNFGTVIPMEVFHRWHAAQIRQRLAWCENNPESNLLLAVDRSLIRKNDELKSLLESSPYFQSHGMLFNDFPSIKATTKLLAQNA